MNYLNGLSLCFDLDGTIIDTAPDLIRVLNLVIKEDGLGETDYMKARRDVGYGARVLIEQACKRVDHAISSSRVDELLDLFLKLYADDIAQKSQPFLGVCDTLAYLRANGAELSVCTNKPGYLARPLLEALDMSGYFIRTIGSDDVPHKKPNAGHIFAAAGHKSRRKIVMIGDSLLDILAAKNTKIPSIVVTYGYSAIPIQKLGADHVIRRFRALPAALRDVLD